MFASAMIAFLFSQCFTSICEGLCCCNSCWEKRKHPVAVGASRGESVVVGNEKSWPVRVVLWSVRGMLVRKDLGAIMAGVVMAEAAIIQGILQGEGL